KRYGKLYGCRGRVGRRRKKGPPEGAPGLGSRDDYRVEAEPASVTVQCEDQHQYQEKEIGPGPLALRAVKAEPQIEYLQRSYDAPETHKNTEEERNCGQHFESIDKGREQVEMRQHDIVDKIGLSGDRGRFSHDPHPIGETGVTEGLFGMI